MSKKEREICQLRHFLVWKQGQENQELSEVSPPPSPPYSFHQPVPGVQIAERGKKIHAEKKNRGRTRGGKGGQNAFSRSHHPPPRPVFPVYNLSRSPFTAVLYYLNAWNRLSFHWRQSTKKVVKNFLTTVWRRIQSRKITIHLEECPSLRRIRKTPNTKKTTPPPHVRHKECGRSDLRKTYKSKNSRRY